MCVHDDGNEGKALSPHKNIQFNLNVFSLVSYKYKRIYVIYKQFPYENYMEKVSFFLFLKQQIFFVCFTLICLDYVHITSPK